MKRIKYLLVLLLALVPFIGVDAKTTTTKASKKEPINFYIFYGSTCGYCASLHEYVAKLEADSTINYMFNVVDYEVWGNEDNSSLMSAVAENFGEQATGVPYYVIGEKSFTGFSEESSAENIKKAIKDAYNNSKYKDVVAGIAKNTKAKADDGTATEGTATGSNENLSASQEEKNNSVTGYIILGITALAIVLIVVGRGKSSNEIYEDVVETETAEVVEPVETVKTTKTVKKTTKKVEKKSSKKTK